MRDKRCGACSRLMSAYATACPWCGRSVIVVQSVRLAALMGVAAVALLLVVSIRGERLRRLTGIENDPQATTSELRARQQDPAWLTWLERAVGAGRRDPAARAERILAERGGAPTETAALQTTSCQPRDTSQVLRWLAQFPEFSDADIRQLACGIIPAGVSAAQVKAIFGPPTRVARAKSGDEEWIYRGSRVLLRNGRVVSAGR